MRCVHVIRRGSPRTCISLAPLSLQSTGKSPLVVAAIRGDEPLVRILLQHGYEADEAEKVRQERYPAVLRNRRAQALCLLPAQDGTTPIEMAWSLSLRRLLLQTAEKSRGYVLSPGLRQMGTDHADVKLVCDGKEFSCNSFLLAANGEYWKALFFGPHARRASELYPPVRRQHAENAIFIALAGRLRGATRAS